MRCKLGAVLLCTALLACGNQAYGAVADYKTITEKAEKEDRTLQTFETDDGSGGTVKVAACEETVYVTAKTAGIFPTPSEAETPAASLALGDEVQRTGVCDNGWSKVSFQKDGSTINGYIQNQMLSEDIQIQPVNDEVEVKTDSSILDYPGRKDGEVVGEVLELDEVKRTGTVNGVWSRIEFLDADGAAQTGYIPTSVLDLPETVQTASIDEELNAGTLHKSSGEGVFADAIEAGGTVTEENGVQIGTPVAASSDANLKSLGTFRITHYCPCSICCGPWANGITSTGVTATTNHTIAVDPSQIPYGSQVVINGQVYVAEDCGGAIKTNCIDIYVASHAEGEAKGVYYTEVYLIQ
ncbi:MAG TPA: 3D domain-containing protein [Candidatus Choladousia intestinigallinarum]|nr:3D domain-containing protein [Candidatus Choladousia intestinigallinarum]